MIFGFLEIVLDSPRWRQLRLMLDGSRFLQQATLAESGAANATVESGATLLLSRVVRRILSREWCDVGPGSRVVRPELMPRVVRRNAMNMKEKPKQC